MSEIAHQIKPAFETVTGANVTFPAPQQENCEVLQTRGVLSFSPTTCPLSREMPSLDDYRTFRDLTRKWYYERGSTSSTTKIVNCESYRAIIGIGKKAIPLILWQLQQEPDFWFAALRALTCEDPVPDSNRGNLRRMTEAWLGWAVRCGYLEPRPHPVNGHR